MSEVVCPCCSGTHDGHAGSDVDLLGHPVEPMPRMEAPLPWRVYRMNGCDWVMARSPVEALGYWAEYCAQCHGAGAWDEARMRAEDLVDVDCPRELTDAELDTLKFTDEEEIGEDDEPVRRTFREELARRAAEKSRFPPKPIAQFFASTEY